MRQSRVNPISKDRARKRGAVFGPVCDWARNQPCVITGYQAYDGSVHPAHVYSRGAGYKDLLVDGTINVVPMRWDIHAEYDSTARVDFENHWCIDIDHVRLIIDSQLPDDVREAAKQW